ncbi:membrane binding-domain-containing protein [Aspergillus alliaceus]|uniref:Membrane binding-domain-containing protein n=1 Tax=Petromyces alliaceus TaxID=209559 RepID=A0A5N7CBD0_PETAA|nr:membrane binding-domain-containing protein [Aspergillus alliaceus]
MVAADTVEFYAKTNYEELKKTARLSELEHTVLGTSYRSCRLGDGTKLFVWNHTQPSTNAEWVKDQPDIPASGPMQCYQVLKGDTSVARVKFEDDTGGNPGDFTLILKLANIGDVNIPSKDGKYAPAGVVPRDDSLVTTAVYVRKRNGEYPVTGSLYFQWNKSTQKVEILEKDNWPKDKLKHQADSANNFTITLIST